MKKKWLVLISAGMLSLSSCSIFVSSRHHRAGVEVGSVNNPNQKDSQASAVKVEPAAVK